MTLRTVSGTGHRLATRTNPGGITPEQLPWVREKCRAGLLWLRDLHCTVEVWSGMALGWDLILAATAVELGFPLRAKVPYLSQSDRWPDEKDRAEWRRLVDLAVSVDMTGPNPASKREAAILLHRRNDALLKADGMFALWDAAKRTGGTFSAVKKAAKGGVVTIHLDPALRRVCGVNCACITSLRPSRANQSSLFAD